MGVESGTRNRQVKVDRSNGTEAERQQKQLKVRKKHLERVKRIKTDSKSCTTTEAGSEANIKAEKRSQA